MDKNDNNKAVLIKKLMVGVITLLLIMYIIFSVLKTNVTQIKTESEFAVLMTKETKLPSFV